LSRSSSIFLVLGCAVLFGAAPSASVASGDYRDCLSSCEASGCGANVGGGCFHICGNLRDPSAENVARISARFREIAEQRTLDAISGSAAIIGIARVGRVTDPGRYGFTAELEFIEQWKSDGSATVVLDGSYQDECEDSWGQIREDQLALFFLEPAKEGKHRISGLGWGRFELSGSSEEALATGDPPLPSPVRATLPDELRRSGGWRAPLSALRAYVDSRLRAR
jgi:hypothetical protein